MIELAVPENSRPFELAAFQISRAALVPNKSLVSVTSIAMQPSRIIRKRAKGFAIFKSLQEF